jgi:hypothetical protein
VEDFMRKYMPKPTLKNYVARYKTDKRLLETYTDGKERELLEKRIARHERDIIAYVTSERFEYVLNHLDI